MSNMIKLLFEPSVLGVSHVWCATCGEVTDINNIKWVTDPKGDEEPHSIECDCGEQVVLDHIVFDGFGLSIKGAHKMFPRHKPIKVWEHVTPYKTKKGHMSEWKLNAAAGDKDTRTYDKVQKRTMLSFKLGEILEAAGDSLGYRYETLYSTFGDINVHIDILRRSKKFGVFLIHERRAWRKHHRDKEVSGWRKSYDKDKKQMVWVDTAPYYQAMEESGTYSLSRGGLVRHKDGSSQWWDPIWKGYFDVDDAEVNWYHCPYDESQGDDPDEDSWVLDALEDDPITTEDIESSDSDDSDEE